MVGVSIVGKAETVVDTGDLRIDEVVGNVACARPRGTKNAASGRAASGATRVDAR